MSNSIYYHPYRNHVDTLKPDFSDDNGYKEFNAIEGIVHRLEILSYWGNRSDIQHIIL